MSWERSRFIPWSKLDQVDGQSNMDGYSFEAQKERVFRTLNREANREKEELKNNNINVSTTTSTSHNNNNNDENMKSSGFVPPEVLLEQQKQKNIISNAVEYSTPDLIRSLAFGACIGSITGSVFGFMDGMRTAQENSIIKNASNSAKAKYLFQGTTRSGMTFGLFFSGFHSIKYGIRVIMDDPGFVYETMGASLLSLGALVVKPAMRQNVPYAAMLIGMDCFSIYMKENA